VTEILKNRKGSWGDASKPTAFHEAMLLNLSVEKASRLLDWKPRWNFEETIKRTVNWYELVNAQKMAPLEITIMQISEFQRKREMKI
jgi:CDP-glucose 4,6-dehydratase